MINNMQPQIVNNEGFQINGNFNNYLQNQKDNINNSILLLNQINDSINESLSQSITDMVNCFICLCPAQDPFSCPKCNNFACKTCFEIYFRDGQSECPLCKGEIDLNELKRNKVIEDIEKVLDKKENNKKKVFELSLLISERKRIWKKQANNVNALIDKIYRFKENLESYKNEYIILLSKFQKLLEKNVKEYNKKIDTLVNSLIKYNKLVEDSISKFNVVYDNNQKYTQDIKKLINDILSLERMKFNDKTKQITEEFLNSIFSFIPSVSNPNIHCKIFNKNIFEDEQIIKLGNVLSLGKFCIIYNTKKNQGEKVIFCKLNITLDDKNNNKCLLMFHLLNFSDVKKQLIPMKCINNEGNSYTFESKIIIDDSYFTKDNKVSIRTEALALGIRNTFHF